MVPSFQFHLISAVSCALFPSCSLCSSPASYFHRSRRVCVFLVLPLNLKTTSSTDEDLPASSTFGSTLLVQVRHNQEALNQRSFTLTVINPWHIFNDAVSHDTTSIFFFIPWLSWLYLVFLHPQIIWWNNLKIEMILWTNLQACTPFRKKMFLRSCKQKMLRAT